MRLAQSHKILGVLFLVLLIAAVWMTNAIFTKKFADYDEVTLQTSKIGLQLPDPRRREDPRRDRRRGASTSTPTPRVPS